MGCLVYFKAALVFDRFNLALAEKSIAATGYEDISLLSLSTGDYCCLAPLMEQLMGRYLSKHVAISFPSVRAGTLTPRLMSIIKKVRKTGFTIAPEAGSQRLRSVINKNITEKEIFETVTKVGTGFTDADLEKLPKLLDKHKISHRHPRIESTIDVDVWFEPSVVIEIRGAELTLSPVHTCAMTVIREKSGLAIRFPRFTGKYRVDKSAEDATTTEELVEMYRSQLKKIDG